MEGSRLTKKMRLSGKKAVGSLFTGGSSFFIYPFKVVFIVRNESLQPFQRVLFSVSRRNFKHAVDRNLLKRRMREAWRINLLTFDNKMATIDVGLIYTGKKIESYQYIEEKIIVIIGKLSEINEVHQ